MSTPKRPRTPTYRHYKPKDLAVVRLNGKDHYLGKFNSPESWERYHRLIAEWHANGHSANEPAQPDPTTGFLGINNVVEAYLDFARGYYSKGGEVGREYENLAYALEPLCDLYGLTNANEFGRADNHNIWEFSARVLATLGAGGQRMSKSGQENRGYTTRNDGLSVGRSTFQAVRAY